MQTLGWLVYIYKTYGNIKVLDKFLEPILSDTTSLKFMKFCSKLRLFIMSSTTALHCSITMRYNSQRYIYQVCALFDYKLQ